MREITKIISIPVNGKSMDFRLTKLDAFSGVTLLRLLSRMPAALCHPEGTEGSEYPPCHPEGTEGSDPQSSVLTLFSALPESDLRSLMTTCLEHVEVSLPAGWYPVMIRGEWGFPDLQYEPGICLKLTIEEVVWTLEGFFGEGGSKPPPVIPAS